MPNRKLADGIFVKHGYRLTNHKGTTKMKLIMAIIKPFRLEEVRQALLPLGVEGMTISEVKGFGRQKGQTEIYRGAEYEISFVPKVKLEIAVKEGIVEEAVEAIIQTSKTGKIGDGKIFVYSLDSVVRIRTGDTGAEAL